MKIAFTGGGTGGHFYPIIAVAEEINRIAREEHLLEAELFYLASTPYDKRALFENNIVFKAVPAGKLRRYFSLLNLFDIFKTGWGILTALITVFKVFPDVIFSKGGYDSLPVVLSAKILGIPLIIHESDSAPGKANVFAGKFAKRVAISYAESATFFPKEKTALLGVPIRRQIMIPAKEGAFEFLKLETNLPTILIMGGSQGAKLINDTVLEVLPNLLEKYQIIHQTGLTNFEEVDRTAKLILKDSPYKNRYRPFNYLNDASIKMASGATSLVVSRAGSAIFEIAVWGKPSIIIPITDSNGDHQRKNAFEYSRSGACLVIEEDNLSPHIFISEIDRLLKNPELLAKMGESAKNFSKPEASQKLAREIIRIALEHEKV